jgi:hypothetical protein
MLTENDHIILLNFLHYVKQPTDILTKKPASLWQ